MGPSDPLLKRLIWGEGSQELLINSRMIWKAFQSSVRQDITLRARFPEGVPPGPEHPPSRATIGLCSSHSQCYLATSTVAHAGTGACWATAWDHYVVGLDRCRGGAWCLHLHVTGCFESLGFHTEVCCRSKDRGQCPVKPWQRDSPQYPRTMELPLCNPSLRKLQAQDPDL